MKRMSIPWHPILIRYSALFIFFLTVLVPCRLVAQDYKFTISTTQPWTDTGVDLQAGDVVAISAAAHSGSSCDPAGASSSASAGLPVPTALPGALIARLQENGTPMLVGASQQLRVAQAGHLSLGINAAGAPPCQGSYAVKVHITPAGAAGGAGANATAATQSLTGTSETSKAEGSQPADQSSTANGEKDVKDIKGALQSATQTWLSGQFGLNAKSGSGTTPTSSAATSGSTPDATSPASTAALPPLKLSTAPLDSQLRKNIDSLPRRVTDQFQHDGDMVNFVIVGSLQKVQDALLAADWHVADRDVKESVLKAALETYQKKAYLAMPMSDLYLFGRVQDYGYEQAEAYAVVASRHHFRIWKTPFQWEGQDVWAGAGTHDIGFEKDQRNGNVTHKIDPAVDNERENIGATLQKGGKVKSLTFYLPPNPVQDARNATGGGYHSDGRILVIQLQ
jgi:hypothetical protein